jgi:hypothetical protein
MKAAKHKVQKLKKPGEQKTVRKQADKNSNRKHQKVQDLKTFLKTLRLRLK